MFFGHFSHLLALFDNFRLSLVKVNTWYEGGGEQGDWRKEDGEGICGVLFATLAGKALHGPGPEIVVLGCVSGVFWFENKDSLGDIWGCWPEKQIRNQIKLKRKKKIVLAFLNFCIESSDILRRPQILVPPSTYNLMLLNNVK